MLSLQRALPNRFRNVPVTAKQVVKYKSIKAFKEFYRIQENKQS